MALLIFAVLSLLVAGELQAGVVVGGTRFIFPADKESIAILLTNTSQESWLINSKINRPTRWAGGEASTVPAPLLAAPLATRRFAGRPAGSLSTITLDTEFAGCTTH